MDKNILSQSKKRKHEILGTVIRANGRIVGQVIDGVFVKDVSSSKHFLRTPEAIAYSLDTLHAAEAAGAVWLDVLDTDTGTHYRASLAMMWDKGRNFDYGFGSQRYLCLSFWALARDPQSTADFPQATSQTDAPVYEDPTATDDEDVKPLNIKSRAARGVKYTKGTKTLKQMQLFGGR